MRSSHAVLVYFGPGTLVQIIWLVCAESAKTLACNSVTVRVMYGRWAELTVDSKQPEDAASVKRLAEIEHNID